jgi:hypothetical protein
MSFDITKPPPAPPNRTIRRWPFIGWMETKESKQRTKQYGHDLEEYGKKLKKMKIYGK